MIRVFAQVKAPQPIPKYITGKFCEHLGSNIYQGMDAQILRNPTFADYPFGDGRMSPDGVTAFQSDPREIGRQLRQQAQRIGWPEGELDRLVQDREQGLACWWVREGSIESVQVSPDTGPYGGRAQRVQVGKPANGIAQWIFLPLHRVQKFELRDSRSLPRRYNPGSSPLCPGRSAILRNDNRAGIVGRLERVTWLAGGRGPGAG